MLHPQNDMVSLEFLIQTCLHWASRNSLVIVKVFLPWHRSQSIVHMGFCSNELSFSESSCQTLQFRGRAAVALWHHFADGSKKSCELFSFFSVLLLVRMRWQLLCSLHARPKTRSHYSHYRMRKLRTIDGRSLPKVHTGIGNRIESLAYWLQVLLINLFCNCVRLAFLSILERKGFSWDMQFLNSERNLLKKHVLLRLYLP